MAEQERKYDGIFMTVLQQEKQISSFFNKVFRFLQRNTDFFTNQRLAQQICISAFRDSLLVFNKQKEENEKKIARQALKKQNPKTDDDVEPSKIVQKTIEPKQSESNPQIKKEKLQLNKQENKKNEEEPAPKGNGGTTEKYVWTQTLDDLHMYIPVRNTIKGKEIKVDIKPDSFFVQQLGQEPLISGKFYQKILAEDSFWTLEDQTIDNQISKFIHITIQKWKNQSNWWSTPIQGDPEINTQKINPEPSSYSDIEDPETKSTVGQMIFDMQQKQMGKPTSAELKKQELAQSFMKAHPEMDFTNCKFS